MATDAEIEAAVRAMRSVRTVGGVVQDEVLRAYAHAALQAAERAQVREHHRRVELRRLNPTGMLLPEFWVDRSPEALSLANGFAVELLLELVREGLATAEA